MLDWFQLANNKENKTIQLRRYLHQYPELSFEEFQTHDYIVNQLSQLSCDIETPIGRNGIKATFKGLGTGPTIALRADFDALPVEELNDVPYKSKNPGCMHACGHDGHTAILLTVAEILDEHKHLLEGNVVLIFQYGEEIMPGGSQEMIDAGCLENVDRIYGHIYGVVILLELFIHVRGQSWPLQMNLASQLKVVVVMVPNLMKPLTQ